MSAVTELIPSIIQAPMAGVQASELAIAVCNAGGLGSLPCALLNSDGLAKELENLSRNTRKPYNLNFFCHTPPTPDPERSARWRELLAPIYRECGLDINSIPAGPGRAPFSHESADIVEAFKPPIVSFHFGLPDASLMARVKSWGSLILSSATTVAEAQYLEAHGVDAIIAQGLEAGGHRGNFLSAELTRHMGTFALLPQIVRSVKVPVIAAGGIADANGVAAAIKLGAIAAQVGTAYLLCEEATTSGPHRHALKSDGAVHTAITNLFTGRPARGIVNRIIRELGAINDCVPEFPLATTEITPLRSWGEKQNSGDFSPLWSGQNVSGCSEVSAAKKTRELMANVVA